MWSSRRTASQAASFRRTRDSWLLPGASRAARRGLARRRQENQINSFGYAGPSGGEDGIRTHERILSFTPLAGERLRPLGHLSEGPVTGFAEPRTSGVAKAKPRRYLPRHGLVAQLDRVLDYESRGPGFESSPVRHLPSRHLRRPQRPAAPALAGRAGSARPDVARRGRPGASRPAADAPGRLRRRALRHLRPLAARRDGDGRGDGPAALRPAAAGAHCRRRGAAGGAGHGRHPAADGAGVGRRAHGSAARPRRSARRWSATASRR